MKKYKCLVLDHDDTVVNSTSTIHYPCFIEYLEKKLPHLAKKYTLSDYFRKNFDPGVVEFFCGEIGLSAEEMREEEAYWRDYVRSHTPTAFPGMRELIRDFRAAGGYITVDSHSFSYYIERDYKANDLPAPDVIYGWELPPEQRKPSPYTLFDLMRRLSLSPSEILVIDDLKPGYDMARAAGVDFAAAGWAYDVPEIEAFMRKNCDFYFKTVAECRAALIGNLPEAEKFT